MSTPRYEPFALKYRPKTFSDVVGQETVGLTLQNALKTGRLANAFLFSGSRGVGKTSMARILAKALNCVQAVDGAPCGTCEVCAGIAHGDDIDVIEIDGASNRGIDEIRAIRDNVHYAPSRSHFKVYIIDEVHMLTIQAFNALLKTLEEPPPHAKFVFATTDPSAVPETIVSRCQRYEFRRIGESDIVRHLRRICEAESVEAPQEVLSEIARKSEGGLRDSLGLLDQLVAFSGQKIGMEDLERALGLIDAQHLEHLLTPLANGACADLLDALDRVFESGRDAEDVLTQVVEIFRAAMVELARGSTPPRSRNSHLVELVKRGFDLDRLMLALRLCLNARREIKFIGQGRLQLELTFLKIARSKELLLVAELLQSGQAENGAPASKAASAAPRPGPSTGGVGRTVAMTAPPRDAVSLPEVVRRDVPEKTLAPPPGDDTPERGAVDMKPAAAPKAARPLHLETIRAEWAGFQKVLREAKPRSAALLESARPTAFVGLEMTIELPAGSDFQRRQLEGAQKRLIEDLLEQFFGQPIRPAYFVAEKPKGADERPLTQRVYEDAAIRKVIETFSGGVVSVEPEPRASKVGSKDIRKANEEAS